MKFFINNKKYWTNKSITLNDLVQYFNFNSQIFILEYNSTIFDKKSWYKYKIQNNDRIELITIVGGG